MIFKNQINSSSFPKLIKNYKNQFAIFQPCTKFKKHNLQESLKVLMLFASLSYIPCNDLSSFFFK